MNAIASRVLEGGLSEFNAQEIVLGQRDPTTAVIHIHGADDRQAGRCYAPMWSSTTFS